MIEEVTIDKERSVNVLSSYRVDHFRSPSRGIGDQAEREKDPGKSLYGAANGEDRTTNATPTANRQQGKQISDHLKVEDVRRNELSTIPTNQQSINRGTTYCK